MRKSRKREPFEVTIDNLSHEGRGVGRVNGKTVFVAGALPGETVMALKIRGRKSFDEALSLEISKPNRARIAPQCEHYDICGGCTLQHLDPADQIAHKQAVLLELVQHHANTQPLAVLAPLVGDVWHYRRRARLGVKFVEKKGGALVGFREKASPYIADIKSCEVLDERVGYRLTELRELINTLSIANKIPQLEVAMGDQQAALVLRHLEDFSDEDLKALASFQLASGISLFLQPGGADSVQGLNSQTKSLTYQIDDIVFDFTPSNFVQINRSINEKMIVEVQRHLALSEEDMVLDLFCGLGNFTLPFAKRVHTVHGVEGDDSLVALGVANAAKNGLGNATFAKVDLNDEQSLSALDISQFNKVLLDPPRSGAEGVIKSLDFSQVEKLVYVSCNPVTLARDTKYLVDIHQFKLDKMGVMDMFPHTSHVESLAVFTR